MSVYEQSDQQLVKIALYRPVIPDIFISAEDYEMHSKTMMHADNLQPCRPTSKGTHSTDRKGTLDMELTVQQSTPIPQILPIRWRQ